jgi:hypothetical protein
MSPTHEVTDDSGFLAIIDPDAYRGFVQQDWTFEMLERHFMSEMAARHLLIWGTGLEQFWKVQIALQPTKTAGFREVVGTIASTQGRLLLTNYESLTMAAAYSDVSLPQPHEKREVLQLQPGLYDCRIVQLSDPNTDAPFDEPVNFVYEFTPVKKARGAWNEVPWKPD